MPKFAIIAPYIAVLVSAAAPILSVFLTNRFALRQQREMFYHQHRAEVIEGYIRSAGAVARSHNYEELAEYGRYYAEIFFYAPTNLHSDIRALDSMIKGDVYNDQVGEKIKRISLALAEVNPRLKNKYRKRNR